MNTYFSFVQKERRRHRESTELISAESISIFCVGAGQDINSDLRHI
jgi:hypothetical protein